MPVQNKVKTIKSLPSSLAMQRIMVCTDGIFTSTLKDSSVVPVYVERITVLGANGPKKNSTKNIQSIEVAKLPNNATSLNIDFSVKFLDMGLSITSCTSKGTATGNHFRACVNDFIERAKETESLHEVALRYAHRILSGSFLWRNAVLADDVCVTMEFNDEKVVFKKSMDLNPNVFGDYTDDHQKVAGWIVKSLQGKTSGFIGVSAKILIGAGNVEVFPSQTFPIKDVNTTGVSKVLYKKFIGNVGSSETITGQAAMRDQKISNAIRTIDTWYNAFEENQYPISIEMNGASLKDDIFYRTDKKTAASLLKEVEVIDLDSDDAKYMMAIVLRGGVVTSKEG